MSGHVEAIFVASEPGELPAPVERVRAYAGRGLEGNRYYWEDGDAPPGRGITLIAAEAVGLGRAAMDSSYYVGHFYAQDN